ncbi:MAG: polysaccharide deacetylase family protein [Bacillota bacterium]|nr:polysaccharide deacetylase family protein [Bacillota bacterium]
MKQRAVQGLAFFLIIFVVIVISLKGDAAQHAAAGSSDADGLTVFQQAPFTLDGLTFVPVRELAGHLGITLRWDSENNLLILDDGQASFGFKTLPDKPGFGVFIPEPNYHTSNGVITEPETWPYRLDNDRIFLPLRHMAQFFNWKITWLPEQKNVLLTANQSKGKPLSMRFKVENSYSRQLWPPPKRIAYLTFDDGPGEKVTPQILDILRDENIKATFFVVGERVQRYQEILLRIYEEGHAIGNHTYSHQPAVLFSGVGPFMEEIRNAEETIFGVIGERPKIFRMPYGTSFPQWPAYKGMLERNGFRHISWNVNSFDASRKNVSAEQILDEVMKQVPGKNEVIILFHDLGSQTIVDALPDIIRFLQWQGYHFMPIK